MNFSKLIISFVILFLSHGATTSLHAEKAASKSLSPNFVLMIADDLSYTDIGCYGSPNAKTPNIDKLATEGMKFNHCYNAIAMCVPTRNMLYSGLYPMRTGSFRNHTYSRNGTVSMVQYFRQLGYRVGISGKLHVGPQKSFPFEIIPGLTENCVSDTDDYSYDKIREFLVRDRQQPFFLVAGYIQPHVPWTMGNASKYDPAELKLPPHWADTPETRKSYADYLAEVAFLDNQVGELLTILEEENLRENTVVIFLSEQGAQFPGAKWTCWEQGLHAAAVVRWPGKIKPNSESDAIVNYVDFVPTSLDIARNYGKYAQKSVADETESFMMYDLDDLDLDGRSFLDVLLGKTDEHAKYAYGIHNNIPEGPPYPIRSVRTRNFAYIRNLTPAEKYVIKFVQLDPNQPYYPSWRKSAAEGDHDARNAIARNEYRPAEELYDLINDPWEMNNLIESDLPEHKKILAELRAELDNWMKSQNDSGASLDK